MQNRRPLKNLFDLSGRVAVITGGAGLLGKQYTLALLEAGARVAVIDSDGAALTKARNKTSSAHADKVLFFGADITKKSAVERAAKAILRTWRRVDILVNNAALDPKFDHTGRRASLGAFEDYPLELWKRSLDVDLTGAFICSQVFGKIMLKQKKGALVNIGSTYGITAPDQRLYEKRGEKIQSSFKPASYAVTKAGLVHFSRYLASYWGAKNIRVNTLSPGGVFTSQNSEFVKKYSQRTPMGRMAAPHEMSAALLFLVSDASSYVTGANLVADGGWTIW